MTYTPTVTPRLRGFRALHIASEVAPYARSGGLADVMCALPPALARAGVNTMLVVPRYLSVDPARYALARRLEPFDVRLGRRVEKVVVFEGRLVGTTVPVFFVDNPLFHRPELYGEGGKDYPDNGVRFALLSRAALEIAHRLDLWPDVVHAHDWQAGPAILYAKRGAVPGRPTPATVFTIHNLAFQGLQPKSLVEEVGIPWDTWHPDGVEYYDQLSFLKAGASPAERITTVSARYAREIQTKEYGCGLEGYLSARAGRLIGIPNGIDRDVWSPATDTHLAARYDERDPSGKAACKAALQRELGLPARPQLPVIGSVSRWTDQKGFDLVLAAADDLAKLDAQFVFLGSGDAKITEGLAALSRRHPTKFAVRVGYDDRLTHRITAGSDLWLMPSRFEPSGLGQLYALRYGTIPIVRATGGLEDTVVDFDERTRTGNGFKFEEISSTAILSTVKRAIAAFRSRDAWVELVGRALREDHGWDARAWRYVELYERVLAERQGGGRRAA